EIANDLEINADFDSAYIRMHRRLRSSREALDPEVTCNFFKSSVFERTLDVCAERLDERFVAIRSIEQRFNVLWRFGTVGDGISARELATELQLTLLLRLYSTIPVGVASAERAFSRMSFIKNKFRSTTSQERLNGLSLIAIENDVANSLSYGDLLRDFAEKKARRIPIGVQLTDHAVDYS
ncbi:hypothetical protein FOZ60_014264, partial [Perkinsus olseni]